jgi:hypothetical protein
LEAIMHNRTETQLLAHKRAVDTERRAQAILRRRHATQTGMARVATATFGGGQ